MESNHAAMQLSSARHDMDCEKAAEAAAGSILGGHG